MGKGDDEGRREGRKGGRRVNLGSAVGIWAFTKALDALRAEAAGKQHAGAVGGRERGHRTGAGGSTMNHEAGRRSRRSRRSRRLLLVLNKCLCSSSADKWVVDGLLFNPLGCWKVRRKEEAKVEEEAGWEGEGKREEEVTQAEEHDHGRQGGEDENDGVTEREDDCACKLFVLARNFGFRDEFPARKR
eukprot:762724-Hanusia_phi.AAC.3